ncbi:hypothetical protein EDD22DRAFT_956745 [Suillus occidentalis]|nr:hypothetical protein EDD22DRAFT_956745 [Suillus occidentalis]
MALGAITLPMLLSHHHYATSWPTSRTGFSSTDSLITKLMVYVINTGSLTRYSFFMPIPYLDSYSTQHMFNDRYDYIMPNNFIFLAVEFLVAKLYVNSFLALLNARYYGQVNTDSDNSYAFHHRHEVYRPELHAGTSQEEELQASRNDRFQHPDDEVIHLSRSVKHWPIAMTTEMNTFPSI